MTIKTNDQFTYNALNAGGLRNEQWIVTVTGIENGKVQFKNSCTKDIAYALPVSKFKLSLRKVKATRIN